MRVAIILAAILAAQPAAAKGGGRGHSSTFHHTRSPVFITRITSTHRAQ